MPLVRIIADKATPTLPEPGPTLRHHLASLLRDQPRVAPIVVLIHGFRFSPFTPANDPHQHILSLDPDLSCWKAISWPRHLGFGRDTSEGLCIGFGWHARGTLWRAFAEAERAGHALATLIAQIQDIDPTRRIDVVAHSLGARVLLSALPRLNAGSIGRAILMAGAEFGSTALAALQTPAGASAEFINITTRENDLFDAAMEALISAPKPGDRALGCGLPHPARNWLDLQIDQTATLAALASLGFRIPAPAARICHWSAYLRPGLFALYQALLRNPQSLPLALLRAHLPAGPEPRWSRLTAGLAPTWPYPVGWKASS